MQCTRRLEFDAAHRVMLHESKCKYLHGHRYVVEASFQAKSGDGALDALGRVIDFGVIKTVLGAWIDSNWDHNTVLHEDDAELGGFIGAHLEQKIYYLPYNPTAENMAAYLLKTICPKLFADHAVECVHIKLYETPNCSASVSV